MTILQSLIGANFPDEGFTLGDAYAAAPDAKPHSVRARIYENLGVAFNRVAAGLYTYTSPDGQGTALIVEGDGRSLSHFDDASIDAIITDHPWEDTTSNKGGNRSFADYEAFRYTQEDFNEKARILKDGSFLVEFLPAENENNVDYLYQIKSMAKAAGFSYYSKVSWTKGSFVANTGRKAKNTEDVMIFTKGKARALRPNAKKIKASYGDNPPAILDDHHLMSGTTTMLPTDFNVQPPSRKERIHQAEKPVDLIAAIIAQVSKVGELILDTFAGSGVTLEAALRTGRICYRHRKRSKNGSAHQEPSGGPSLGKLERNQYIGPQLNLCKENKKMSTSIQETINHLRELDQKASPAPWGWSGGGQGSPILSANDAVGRLEYATEEDLDLITETRNAVPALLAEIERLTAENRHLSAYVAELEGK